MPDSTETLSTVAPLLPLLVGSLDLFEQLLQAGKVCGKDFPVSSWSPEREKAPGVTELRACPLALAETNTKHQEMQQGNIGYFTMNGTTQGNRKLMLKSRNSWMACRLQII